MTERRRPLPSWMSKKEEETQKESPRRCRKRKVAKSVFYCMNEEELVEAAVSCLTSSGCEDVASPADHQVGNTSGDTTVKKAASLKTVTEVSDEDSSDCGDALETTYVSETDVDITEVETLPYTEESPLQQRRRSPAPGPVTQGHGAVMDVELEAESGGGRPQPEEDEALKLVREIFFT